MQDLYTEYYETLLEENKEDLNKWKGMCCSWIRRLNMSRFHFSSTLSRDSMK